MSREYQQCNFRVSNINLTFLNKCIPKVLLLNRVLQPLCKNQKKWNCYVQTQKQYEIILLFEHFFHLLKNMKLRILHSVAGPNVKIYRNDSWCHMKYFTSLSRNLNQRPTTSTCLLTVHLLKSEGSRMPTAGCRFNRKIKKSLQFLIQFKSVIF